MFNKDSFIN